MVAPGVKHVSIYRPAGPWAIQVLEVDTTQNYISVATVLAGDQIPGLETVSASAARVSRADRYAVAGVNGDYFIRNWFGFQGGPLGFQVLSGEVITSPVGRSALIVRADGAMTICRPVLRASVQAGQASFNVSSINSEGKAGELALCTPRGGRAPAPRAGLMCAALQPDSPRLTTGTFAASVGRLGASPTSGTIGADEWLLCGDGAAAEFLRALAAEKQVTLRVSISCGGQEDNIAEAIGGGPRLLQDGAPCADYQQEGFSADFAQRRHPRTAVGIDGRRLVLAVVDGRQEPYSAGMTLAELTGLMAELGCKEALNLDGGGSTTIWVRDRVRNSPSDGVERPVANCLLVFSKAPKGPPARLVIDPPEIRTIAGQTVPIAWHFEDENYNPVAGPEKPKWDAAALGSVDDSDRFLAAVERGLPSRGALTPESRRGTVTGSAAGMTATVPATVYSSAPTLRLFPASVRLEVGQMQRFALAVADENGLPLAYDPATITWDASGPGEFMTPGLFHATHAGPGTVRASLAGRIASAEVVVYQGAAPARQSVAVEDFERTGTWTFSAWPATVKGSLARCAGGLKGKWAGELEYDFTNATAACAAYAGFDRTLPAVLAPAALSLWVRGDGRGHWLRARLRDEKGEKIVLDLARRIEWKDEWRQVQASLPDGRGRLVLESIYVVETDPTRCDAGRIGLDQITVEGRGSDEAK